VIEETKLMADVKLRQINTGTIAAAFQTLDRNTKEPGYCVYIFSSNNTFKADLNEGNLAFNHLFRTEDEAFSEVTRLTKEYDEKAKTT
jgi:hypothetical protein